MKTNFFDRHPSKVAGIKLFLLTIFIFGIVLHVLWRIPMYVVLEISQEHAWGWTPAIAREFKFNRGSDGFEPNWTCFEYEINGEKIVKHKTKQMPPEGLAPFETTYLLVLVNPDNPRDACFLGISSDPICLAAIGAFLLGLILLCIAARLFFGPDRKKSCPIYQHDSPLDGEDRPPPFIRIPWYFWTVLTMTYLAALACMLWENFILGRRIARGCLDYLVFAFASVVFLVVFRRVLNKMHRKPLIGHISCKNPDCCAEIVPLMISFHACSCGRALDFEFETKEKAEEWAHPRNQIPSYAFFKEKRKKALKQLLVFLYFYLPLFLFVFGAVALREMLPQEIWIFRSRATLALSFLFLILMLVMFFLSGKPAFLIKSIMRRGDAEIRCPVCGLPSEIGPVFQKTGNCPSCGCHIIRDVVFIPPLSPDGNGFMYPKQQNITKQPRT